MKSPLWRKLMASVLGIGLIGAGASAQEGLSVGDKAPEFELEGSDGKTYRLADFNGKKPVVIAWYPKAFTGGCTKQCISYANAPEALRGLDVAYFTASVDDVETNTRFAESVQADYPILSDPTKEVAKAYGVLRDSGVTNRVTFYIDKDGVIQAIDSAINTENAAADTAAKLIELGLASE